MALILKENKTYNYKGIELSNAYLVIDQIRIDKQEKVARFTYSIYSSKEERNKSKNILVSDEYIVRSNFNDYFSTEKLIQSNPYAQAYIYMEHFIDIETGNLEWEDWISDEI